MTICTQSRLKNFRRRGGDSFIYQHIPVQNRVNTKCVFAASEIRYRVVNIERMTAKTREDGTWQYESAEKLTICERICIPITFLWICLQLSAKTRIQW